MKGYISYFKTVLISSLQYKAAAMAGIFTQFFWGLLQIFIYQAFYEGTGQTVPMDFNKLVTYVWLQQSLLALIYVRNKDEGIIKSIKDGTVAYEMVRPYNLYIWWYIKGLAKRYAAVFLRAWAIILIALFLPKPYNLQLPASLETFCVFSLILFLGSLIVTAILLIIQTITFFTYDEKGISNLIFNLSELLSGMSLPLPLLPEIVQKICYIFPFWLIGDVPFRVFSGDIILSSGYKIILLQIFWVAALVASGMFLLKYAMKKVYIQGG